MKERFANYDRSQEDPILDMDFRAIEAYGKAAGLSEIEIRELEDHARFGARVRASSIYASQWPRLRLVRLLSDHLQILQEAQLTLEKEKNFDQLEEIGFEIRRVEEHIGRLRELNNKTDSAKQ